MSGVKWFMVCLKRFMVVVMVVVAVVEREDKEGNYDRTDLIARIGKIPQRETYINHKAFSADVSRQP